MKIITYPNKILMQIAEPVRTGEVAGLGSVIKNMISVMRLHGGLGLSAPQVGISKRFFVWIDSEGNEQVFINPSIVSLSGRIKIQERCLSFPNIQRTIKRKRIVELMVESETDRRLAWFKNMDAVIIQHEIDHLNGITILDNAKKRNK